MRCLAAVLLAALILVAPASAAAPPPGGLTQLAKRSGCLLGPAQARFVGRSGCGTARDLGSTQHLVISADGRFAYAISNDTWSLESFSRDAGTGALTQLPGAAGCLADVSRPSAGCGAARGLVWAFDLELTPDGTGLIATGGIGDAVAWFTRNPVTGVLSAAGCLRNPTGGDAHGGPSPAASGCALVDGLRYPRGIAIAPDGRFAYVAAFNGGGVTGLTRDPATGALSAAPGACAGRGAACTPAALRGVTDVTITGDGRFLYASAFGSDAVVGFARDGDTGALTPLAGCDDAASAPTDPRPAEPAAPTCAAGCIAAAATATCTQGRALDGVYDLALSPDERQLYVASRHSRGLAILQRDPATGALSELPGPAGCIAEGAIQGCARGRGLKGARGVVVTPDGRDVYAGAFDASAVSAFTRAPGTGALTQLHGRAGCLSSRVRTCAPARAVHQAWAVAPSPDGRFLYSGVGGNGNSGLAVFRRR